jgi:hypothetical protein
MTPLELTLARAQVRLQKRLDVLEARLDSDESAWVDFTATVTALVGVLTEPSYSGRPVSQRELAEKFGVSPRTIRRRRRKAAAGGRILKAVGPA